MSASEAEYWGCIAGTDEEPPPIVCPTTGGYCVRAFCEDYGCANEAGASVTQHDVDCGSDPDDMPSLSRRRNRKTDQRQATLL